MKIVNAILTILFLLFAAVQLNDPDPWLWVALYSYVAIISALAFFKNYNKYAILIGITVSGIWLINLLPDFITWIQGGAESIVDSMKAEKPHIELTREFLGLILVILVLAFQYRSFVKQNNNSN